ncbi:LPS export ABC transporter periplasmic protein LptC [Pampinifervens florentissimum]|uniref:LPS export ABC transporter periplasmic protein LptC n=1 Tax=Pampinifervens florentissimum TaxID=1632019 RepID=UPI0013B492FE|nr:LPS export ABC transporter periplasmic protein LptC [Hydrogenobacter sp. T-8]QID33536.1 LPS export ABC transporter periplasmic protein LptC [Hydrogenobacter sp. T-8]
MLRSLLLSILIILLASVLKMYVDSFAMSGGQEEMVSLLEGVTIKAYSKTGIEWTIRGKTLEVVGKDVKLYEAELFSKEANIRAVQAYIDRSTGEGKLTEGVEVKSEDITAKTQNAYINLKEGKIWGEGDIQILQGESLVRGKGFEITLKPLKVIINRARTDIR